MQHLDEEKFKRKFKKCAADCKKYETFFENANEAVFVADAGDGTIVDCNRAAEKLTGYTRRELIGKNHKFLHPVEHAKEIVNLFAFHLQKGSSVDPAEIITKDGRKVPILISASAFKIGRRRFVQGVFSDLTSFKKIYEELEKQRHIKSKVIDVICHRFTELLKDIKRRVQGFKTEKSSELGPDLMGSLDKAIDEIDSLLKMAEGISNL